MTPYELAKSVERTDDGGVIRWVNIIVREDGTLWLDGSFILYQRPLPKCWTV